MPQLKLGLRLSVLGQPFVQSLRAANRLGVQGVELDARGEIRPKQLGETGLRQLRKMLADHNLAVSGVRFRSRRGYDLADQLDERVEGTKEAMRFAAQLGARLVFNRVGHIPPEPKGPAWELMLGVLGELGAYGQRHGAILAAETGGDDAPDLARLLASLPEGSLAVDFDPGSVLVNGFSPLGLVEAVGPAIAHVRATDGVRDLARGRGLDVPLGQGSVDFPALLGALEERGYRGYFTVGRPGSSDPLGEVTAAVEYLRNL